MVSVSDELWAAVTVLLAVFVIVLLLGSFPVTVPVLRIEPASTSAWVTV